MYSVLYITIALTIFLLVKVIHIKDDDKHKYKQSEEDNQYNYHFYYDFFKTRISPTVNDMKFLLGISYKLISKHAIEVGKNLEYTLKLNTNLPKVRYELGPRLWRPKELRNRKK